MNEPQNIDRLRDKWLEPEPDCGECEECKTEEAHEKHIKQAEYEHEDRQYEEWKDRYRA